MAYCSLIQLLRRVLVSRAGFLREFCAVDQGNWIKLVFCWIKITCSVNHGIKLAKKLLWEQRTCSLKSVIMSCQKLDDVISIIALTGNKLPLLFRPRKNISQPFENLIVPYTKSLDQLILPYRHHYLHLRHRGIRSSKSLKHSIVVRGFDLMFWNLRSHLNDFRFPLIDTITLPTFLLNNFLRWSFDPRPSYIIQWCRCRNRQGKHRIGSIYHLKPFTTRVNTCLSLEYFRILSCVATGKENTYVYWIFSCISISHTPVETPPVMTHTRSYTDLFM